MTKFKKFLSNWGVFFLLLILALFARAWRMEFLPFQSDADELAFVFAGQSLLEQGTPISWSSFSYDEQSLVEPVFFDLTSFKAEGTFTFVRPWFDHPFLLSILLGGISEMFGFTFPSIPPSLLLRVPMLFLSGVTLTFVYLIAQEFFDRKSAWLALAIAGFSPVLILGQRMAVGENLYLPLLLGGLYLLIKSQNLKNKSKAVLTNSGAGLSFASWGLLGAMVLAAAAGWSKMTGLVAIPILGSYLLLNQKYKSALTFILGSIFIWAGVYLLYGWLIDWPQFWLALTKQSYRLVGWSNPAFILSHPGFHHFIVYDLSYYLILILGFLGIYKAQGKSQKFLLISTLGTMALIWLSSAEQDNLGWYKLPFFTFLSIATGGVFHGKKSNLLLPTSLLWLTIINNIGLVRFFPHILPEPQTLRLVVASILMMLFGPYFLPLAEPAKKRWLNLILIIAIATYALQALYFADQYYFSFCQHQDCPVPVWQTTQLLKSIF